MIGLKKIKITTVIIILAMFSSCNDKLCLDKEEVEKRMWKYSSGDHLGDFLRFKGYKGNNDFSAIDEEGYFTMNGKKYRIISCNEFFSIGIYVKELSSGKVGYYAGKGIPKF